MDIQDLILVGKLSKAVSFKDKKTGQVVEVELSTPIAEDVKRLGGEDMDVAEFVSYFVDRIGNTVYPPENRKIIKEALGKIQGVVLGYLNKQCMELLNEQEKFVEELTKK